MPSSSDPGDPAMTHEVMRRSSGTGCEAGPVDITVRPATRDDRPALRAIERRAGERFREVGMPEVADDEPPSLDVLATFVDAGRAWVVPGATGEPVGYAVVEEVDGNAHIEQVSVDPAYQGQRVGRALIDEVATWATRNRLPAITLTTFVDVAWNAPLYRHLGFVDIPDKDLGPGLRAVMQAEAAHGLDPRQRVAMRRPVDP